MAVIRSRAGHLQRPELPPLDPVDDLLFGREIDVRNIHPQVREIYSGVFKQLEEMDHVSTLYASSVRGPLTTSQALDELLNHVAHAF